MGECGHGCGSGLLGVQAPSGECNYCIHNNTITQVHNNSVVIVFVRTNTIDTITQP